MVPYNTTVGVLTRATSTDAASLLDLTPGMILLAFCPRNREFPSSGVGAIMPLLHFEPLTSLCGMHPTNTDHIVLLRLLHDEVGHLLSHTQHPPQLS